MPTRLEADVLAALAKADEEPPVSPMLSGPALILLTPLALTLFALTAFYEELRRILR